MSQGHGIFLHEFEYLSNHGHLLLTDVRGVLTIDAVSILNRRSKSKEMDVPLSTVMDILFAPSIQSMLKFAITDMSDLGPSTSPSGGDRGAEIELRATIDVRLGAELKPFGQGSTFFEQLLEQRVVPSQLSYSMS